MVNELYSRLFEIKINRNKVSSFYLRKDSLIICRQEKEKDPYKRNGLNFKASPGWLERSIKKNNIKFRKRNNLEQKLPEEEKNGYLKFLSKLDFDILCSRDGDSASKIDELRGLFLPRCM